MNSVKKNFAWSSILTIAGYLFPLITFPYVTRVLGVNGLGNYQFAISVIQYFSVFSLLGIGTVGIREIAKTKDDKSLLSEVYSSLLLLCLCTTVISIIALIILIQFIPAYETHSKLLYIGCASILANSLLVEWFYKGIEDFKYITIRAIAVRVLYVISVFVFVRKPNDYVIYFTLTTLITVLNAIINQIYSRKFIRFSIKRISFRPYIKPFVTLGIYQFLTAMYISFNVMFLGLKCGDTEVGFYSSSVKLYTLAMSLFTAFTGVMLPRMSYLVESGNVNQFKYLTSKSIDCLLLFSIPLIVVSEIFAPEIIRIIAGNGFEGAILPMRIIMPLMLVVGYEQIIIVQMLSPLRKDKAILINSCFGAGVSLILNLTIVPALASVGSAIAWFTSEIAVLLSAQYFVTKYIGYRIPLKKIFLTLVLVLPIILITIIVKCIVVNWIFALVVGSSIVLICFGLIEFFILKNEVLVSFLTNLRKKIKF